MPMSKFWYQYQHLKNSQYKCHNIIHNVKVPKSQCHQKSKFLNNQCWMSKFYFVLAKHIGMYVIKSNQILFKVGNIHLKEKKN